jgi:hypothetical protein
VLARVLEDVHERRAHHSWRLQDARMEPVREELAAATPELVDRAGDPDREPGHAA